MIRPQHQPFRDGRGVPGASLSAMLAGRPAFLPNPQDYGRAIQRGRPQLPRDLLEALAAYQAGPIRRPDYNRR